MYAWRFFVNVTDLYNDGFLIGAISFLHICIYYTYDYNLNIVPYVKNCWLTKQKKNKKREQMVEAGGNEPGACSGGDGPIVSNNSTVLICLRRCPNCFEDTKIKYTI